MTANEYLALFVLAGVPIDYAQNNVARWFAEMRHEFKITAMDRMQSIWSQRQIGTRQLDDYKWAWACACEYAWRKHEAGLTQCVTKTTT